MNAFAPVSANKSLIFQSLYELLHRRDIGQRAGGIEPLGDLARAAVSFVPQDAENGEFGFSHVRSAFLHRGDILPRGSQR
jgi:hypothetical protein